MTGVMAFRHASHQASSRSAGSYRVQEFARLAGVTVRALHHYDRLKLLTPARSRAGYRLYRDSDLARLEQIVVLKFIGVPLTEIRRLLKRELPLPAALGRQRQVLAHKRDRIDAAMQAIEAAGRSVRGQSADWDLFKTIVKEVQMQNDTD